MRIYAESHVVSCRVARLYPVLPNCPVSVLDSVSSMSILRHLDPDSRGFFAIKLCFDGARGGVNAVFFVVCGEQKWHVLRA
jgi:hypothetical protein